MHGKRVVEPAEKSKMAQLLREREKAEEPDD